MVSLSFVLALDLRNYEEWKVSLQESRKGQIKRYIEELGKGNLHDEVKVNNSNELKCFPRSENH